MTFIIDENLSWRLIRLMSDEFPGIQHVNQCNLERADDHAVWAFAKTNQLALLSKDDDMRELVQANGPPPKLVWLKLGNVSTSEIARTLKAHAPEIRGFLSGEQDILEIN